MADKGKPGSSGLAGPGHSTTPTRQRDGVENMTSDELRQRISTPGLTSEEYTEAFVELKSRYVNADEYGIPSNTVYTDIYPNGRKNTQTVSSGNSQTGGMASRTTGGAGGGSSSTTKGSDKKIEWKGNAGNRYVNRESGLALYENTSTFGSINPLELSKTGMVLRYGQEVKYTGRKSGGGTWAEVEVIFGTIPKRYWVIADALSVSLAESCKLDIEPMGRQKDMWCWIAVVSMIDKYYYPKDYATQYQIAEALGVPTTTQRGGDGGYVDKYEDEKESRTAVESGFSDRIQGTPSFGKIKEEIKGGRPIAVLTRTGEDLELRHYIAIVGYSISKKGEKYVIINETRHSKNAARAGLQVSILYTDFAKEFDTGRGDKQAVEAFHTTNSIKGDYYK